MMKHKGTFVLALIAGLLVAFSASAQDMEKLAKIPPEVRAKVQTEFMTKKLGLTPEQTPKIAALNLEFAQKMQPVLAGEGGPFQRMREGRSIEQQKDQALQGILSPEQYSKYQASKEELKQKMMEKLKEKAAGGQ